MRKNIAYMILLVMVVGVLANPVATSAKSVKSPSQKVVAKCKSKIGSRYVYGARGSKQFDCSGFVYWIYKNSGVKVKKKVKRTSCQSMYKALKKYKVSSKLSKAKPGDIILYKNGGRYTHAAISTGKGNMIHASSSKRKVCKAKAKACRYSSVAIIRILK